MEQISFVFNAQLNYLTLHKMKIEPNTNTFKAYKNMY